MGLDTEDAEAGGLSDDAHHTEKTCCKSRQCVSGAVHTEDTNPTMSAASAEENSSLFRTRTFVLMANGVDGCVCLSAMRCELHY